MHVAHAVRQAPRLFGDGAHNRGIRMARYGDAEGRGEIDVAILVDVGDDCAGRRFPKDGEVAGQIRDAAGLGPRQRCREFARGGTRNLGDDRFKLAHPSR